MARLPKIAIVGRPNVGKSALFNKIINKRVAIVDEAEGVTRDRLYHEADVFGQPVVLIDTGGIHARSTAAFNEEIKRQAEIAIEEADSLIMVVDGRTGSTALDHEVAQILHRTKKPVCLAVNKIDNLDQVQLLHDFYSLGIEKVIAVSAIQSRNIAELLEAALEGVEVDESEDQLPGIKVAIVGKPNVGKSTFVNHILQEPRCVVSPIAGTTRDSIDVPIEVDGEQYTLIDTAGIRNKHAEEEVVDKFAFIRTERAIERCDVAVLMVDAQEGLCHQDKKIAGMIEEAGKGCILLFNKWDLVKGFRMEHCLQGIREEASFLNHCPVVFLSALTGRNAHKLFPGVKEVYEQGRKRISTGELNRFLEGVMHEVHPPRVTGKRLRVYYTAQVGTEPPEFVMFVNQPELMPDTYRRYLYNQCRKKFKFTGVPLLFRLRGKSDSKKGSKPRDQPPKSR